MENDLFIQALGICGTIVFLLSYQFKTNRKLFRVQLLSYVFYTAHYLLLGAVTGGVSYLLNALRSLFLGSRRSALHSRTACAVLCILQALTLALTWNGWCSLLPVAANIASTIGGYTHNPRKVRLANACINAPLWILYDIIVGSWAGILDEIISVASNVISIVRFGWKALDIIEEAKE